MLDSARTQTRGPSAGVAVFGVWRERYLEAIVVGYGSHGCERTGREQSVQQAVPAHACNKGVP